MYSSDCSYVRSQTWTALSFYKRLALFYSSLSIVFLLLYLVAHDHYLWGSVHNTCSKRNSKYRQMFEIPKYCKKLYKLLCWHHLQLCNITYHGWFTTTRTDGFCLKKKMPQKDLATLRSYVQRKDSTDVRRYGRHVWLINYYLCLFGLLLLGRVILECIVVSSNQRLLITWLHKIVLKQTNSWERFQSNQVILRPTKCWYTRISVIF